MRRDFTQCEFCGNHTVRSHNTICDCCGYGIVPISTSARNRPTVERVIIAIGLALAVAFVLVLAAGHVRAQSLDIPPMTKNGCAIGLVPDGRGACVAPVMMGVTKCNMLYSDNSGKQGWSCTNGSTAWTSDRDQSTKPTGVKVTGGCFDFMGHTVSCPLPAAAVTFPNQTTLVIRNREKKLVLIRGIESFEQCASIRAAISVSPDIEFAECFR